jgi:integrase
VVVIRECLAGWHDQVLFDSLTGFGYRLRQGAGGKVLRTWIVQYRRAGASRRMLIGSAEVVTADQARAKAKKVLAAVVLGDDPQAEKAERRTKDRVTMRAVVDEYIADKASDWRAQTQHGVALYLTGPYFRTLHGMAVDKITRRDVASRLVAIKREHSPIVAAAARAKLSAFFVWCLRQGLTEHNPVNGTEQPKRTASRDRVLSDDELATIWRSCNNGDHGKIVRMMILTGCRRNEIGGMRWSEIAPDKSTWTLPAVRSKNKRALTLPVLPMMRQILDTVPQMASRDQLFGQRSEKGFAGWDKGKQSIDEGSGVTGWRRHDLRRTVATRMCDIGIAPHVVEQILNHRSGHRAGMGGVYNRSPYEREVRNTLAMWERYIGLVIDRDLYAEHQAFLARGDEQAREKASKAFRDAIAAGGGHWEDHIRTLVEGGERKVLNFQPQTAS